MRNYSDQQHIGYFNCCQNSLSNNNNNDNNRNSHRNCGVFSIYKDNKIKFDRKKLNLRLVSVHS